MIGSSAFKQKQMMLNYVFVLHFIANIDIKIDLSVSISLHYLLELDIFSDTVIYNFF